MGKKFEELEFKDDFMFGVIMRNPKYCKPFLETILGIKISHLEYPKSQETIYLSSDAKSVRLEIYVEDGKGTVYNIEMQTASNRNIPKRMRYYQGVIDLSILENIVDQYIIPCYEMLHTQGKEYIVENLKEVMAERGIAL